MTVSYAVRVNESTRDRAAEVARSYGLDLASVTRAFWTQMARTGSIPLSLDYAEPNEASLEAIRETEEIFAENGGGRFGSVEELVKPPDGLRLAAEQRDQAVRVERHGPDARLRRLPAVVVVRVAQPVARHERTVGPARQELPRGGVP